MYKKFFALTMASIMSLNVLPVNVFRKTTHAEINFVSNVNKIAGPENGTGKESTSTLLLSLTFSPSVTSTTTSSRSTLCVFAPL